MPRKYIKTVRKEGYILGIKITSTTKDEVLEFVNSCLDNGDKFYIVTPNPENLLLATKDWLLKKSIYRSDLSVPDGIGLAQAFKFLSFKDNKHNIFRPLIIFYQGILVGLMTIVNKKYLTDSLPIIKGRELFLDIIKIADKRKLRVYFFGGENGEQEKAKKEIEKEFKNIIIKTNHKFPNYNENGQPASEVDRKIHKSIVGDIKLFEADLIFVAMNTPKHEKWIYRNLFRLNTLGAMTVGGTFNYVAGNMRLPPKWVEKIGLEWVYRLIQEPKRWRRILNAFPIFPWRVFMFKLRK